MALAKSPKDTTIFVSLWFYVVLIMLGCAIYFGYVYYCDNWNINYYSAVYLDNGDVYFGKLFGSRREYATLNDVYYFKDSGFIKQNDVSLGSISENGGFTLTKMGSEVHGPENSIKILSKHIVFVERLSQGSKVLEAILSHGSR